MDVSLEAQTKPLSTLSSFSYIPPRRKEPKEMSFFNKVSEAPEVSMYDRVFHQAEGYDMRLRRDDRKHYKGRGLDINKEEKSRVVPVRSSSEYGRRPVPVLYQPGRQYARVACIKAEFFMKNGIIWNVEEGVPWMTGTMRLGGFLYRACHLIRKEGLRFFYKNCRSCKESLQPNPH